VYLVNIIDIYPRAEYPGKKLGEGEAVVAGPLPKSWRADAGKADQWTNVAKRPGLSVQVVVPGESYRLRYLGAMSDNVRDALRLDCSNPAEFDLPASAPVGEDGEAVTPGTAAKDAIDELFDQSNDAKLVMSQLPDAWLPTKLNGDWEAAPAPWQNLEVRRIARFPKPGEREPQAGGAILGWRGVMSDSDRDRLLQMAGNNKELRDAVEGLAKSSRRQKAGRFLGSYTLTASRVFPCIYLFASNEDQPSAQRDTFVVACSRRPLDLSKLYRSGGYWRGRPFAWLETDAQGKQQSFGQMEAVLDLARGLELTDDFAPVDNLLVPVFVDQ
jgi:hypothetical protein